jgi:hypothetical protein
LSVDPTKLQKSGFVLHDFGANGPKPKGGSRLAPISQSLEVDNIEIH